MRTEVCARKRKEQSWYSVYVRVRACTIKTDSVNMVLEIVLVNKIACMFVSAWIYVPAHAWVCTRTCSCMRMCATEVHPEK